MFVFLDKTNLVSKHCCFEWLAFGFGRYNVSKTICSRNHELFGIELVFVTGTSGVARGVQTAPGDTPIGG